MTYGTAIQKGISWWHLFLFFCFLLWLWSGFSFPLFNSFCSRFVFLAVVGNTRRNQDSEYRFFSHSLTSCFYEASKAWRTHSKIPHGWAEAGFGFSRVWLLLFSNRRLMFLFSFFAFWVFPGCCSWSDTFHWVTTCVLFPVNVDLDTRS